MLLVTTRDFVDLEPKMFHIRVMVGMHGTKPHDYRCHHTPRSRQTFRSSMTSRRPIPPTLAVISESTAKVSSWLPPGHRTFKICRNFSYCCYSAAWRLFKQASAFRTQFWHPHLHCHSGHPTSVYLIEKSENSTNLLEATSRLYERQCEQLLWHSAGQRLLDRPSPWVS
jgi:hypothetical protein